MTTNFTLDTYIEHIENATLPEVKEGSLYIIHDSGDYKASLGYLSIDADTVMIFCHMDVHKPTHNTYKRIRARLEKLRENIDRPLFAMGTNDTDTYYRFMTEFLPFQYLRVMPFYGGETRRCFVLYPKN